MDLAFCQKCGVVTGHKFGQCIACNGLLNINQNNCEGIEDYDEAVNPYPYILNQEVQ